MKTTYGKDLELEVPIETEGKSDYQIAVEFVEALNKDDAFRFMGVKANMVEKKSLTLNLKQNVGLEDTRTTGEEEQGQ